MSHLHPDVLSPEQSKLLSSLLKESRKRGFYMVGGTAIALQLWHRKSIDFDLFREKPWWKTEISGIMERAKVRWAVTHIRNEENITWVIQEVKVTFFRFPFPVEADLDFDGYIMLPDLLTLGAMKAYALGRRSKWKDYVDLYFLLRDHLSVKEISRKAEEIFEWNYNSKLFREQLCYFEGIDYREEVEYLIENPPTDEEIKRFLIEKAISD
jgi:hypothetical protein